MDATVIGVEAGLTGHGRGGDYIYMLFKYQPDPYQGKEKPEGKQTVFENMPMYDTLLEFKAGDRVNLKFEKINGYWNIVDASFLNETSSPAQTSGGSSNKTADIYQSKDNYWNDKLTLDKERYKFDIRKNNSIEMECALKAAVELCVAVLKKGDTIDGAYVVKLAQELDAFFQLPKDLACEESDRSTTTSDGEQPPQHTDDEIPF